MNFDAIAHDLKTPLTAVLGSAHLIRTENLTPNARRLLGVIEAQVERMTALIDSYLGRDNALEETPQADAGEILRETTVGLDPLLKTAGVSLEVQIEEQLPRCRCGRVPLQRVIANVLKNAIDATPAGGLVSCRVGSGGMRNVLLEIRDTGSGMQAHILARAFEPGFTTKAGHTGHGLGLAICRDVVRSHGGEISISSRPGWGTRVFITLPASQPPESSPSPLEGCAGRDDPA
jgi:two-component system phosphate regulon sensor histidine kinase PhoR